MRGHDDAPMRTVTESRTGAILQEPETVAILRVNEVADKGTSDTCDGKDWIELHNAGTGTADLSGMVLVDDERFGDEGRYTFANGSSLSGGEYLVLCRSADFAFGIGGDDAVTLFATGRYRSVDVWHDGRPRRVGQHLGVLRRGLRIHRKRLHQVQPTWRMRWTMVVLTGLL